MSYHVNLFKIFFFMEDHLFRIRKAERIHNLWFITILLFLGSILVYGWMAYLGMGSELLSRDATSMSVVEYEMAKAGFVIGRLAYALLFSVLVLFIPSLLFHLLTKLPYRKLLIMQQMVLLVMLAERLTWIPIMLLSGLDWYVSPFSFGILASYFTGQSWVIYFCGAVSLFQLWIIWFQVKYLNRLSSVSKRWLWAIVVILHILYWCLAALLSYSDISIISGWFE
ncbi:hypothetical protein ACFOGI_11570 [Virgibacillus xinjiangensis]|uniref:Yip1 domain-containing protein n=1 Tax=Virgibacillus xinjiangensis TaxID=393090 RepID=A0ABV7CX88_9BACI